MEPEIDPDLEPKMEPKTEPKEGPDMEAETEQAAMEDQPQAHPPKKAPMEDQPQAHPPKKAPMEDQPQAHPPKKAAMEDQPQAHPPKKAAMEDQPPLYPPDKAAIEEQPPSYQSSSIFPATQDFTFVQAAPGFTVPDYGAPPYLSQSPYIIQNAGTMQHGVYVTQAPVRQHYPDYLGYSIVTMLCCCFPLGIVALIHSLGTRDANSSGDSYRAERDSQKARRFILYALGVGIAIHLLGIIFIIVRNSAPIKNN